MCIPRLHCLHCFLTFFLQTTHLRCLQHEMQAKFWTLHIILSLRNRAWWLPSVLSSRWCPDCLTSFGTQRSSYQRNRRLAFRNFRFQKTFGDKASEFQQIYFFIWIQSLIQFTSSPSSPLQHPKRGCIRKSAISYFSTRFCTFVSSNPKRRRQAFQNYNERLRLAFLLLHVHLWSKSLCI